MSGCVFCEIVAGSAPATVLMDGISSIAIEPLNPVTPGHLIVIPRTHVVDAYEDPAVTATTMYDAAAWARLLGGKYRNANIITSIGADATQSVFHLHIHIVPRVDGDRLALPWTDQKESA